MESTSPKIGIICLLTTYDEIDNVLVDLWIDNIMSNVWTNASRLQVYSLKAYRNTIEEMHNIYFNCKYVKFDIECTKSRIAKLKRNNSSLLRKGSPRTDELIIDLLDNSTHIIIFVNDHRFTNLYKLCLEVTKNILVITL